MMLRKRISALLMSVITAVAALSVSVYANDNLLYESKETQTVVSGVTYEKSTRLYKSGWVDAYIITADIQNPNFKFEVLESSTEYGLKKTVEQLVTENSAVAGVNADFFSSGTVRSSMGQVVESGDVKATTNYYNGSENKYGGFFIDGEKTPFIDYLKSVINFYSNEADNLELGAKNKVTDFAKPVYFDRRAMTTTADLDKRFSNLYKIVVSSNKIVDISAAGATVTIPEDGFIIVMNSKTALEKLSNYSLGQTVGLGESESFVFRPEKSITSVALGLSGGGELLRAGQAVSNGLIISPTSRNPRTCIGVNKDKTKVIIMAIDGRGESIGATNYEAASLMLEYGAWDAIHYDGGGSTTMAVRQEGTNDINVVNTPSEGSQRRVANAIGIVSTANEGVLTEIQVSPDSNYKNTIMSGAYTPFTVKGYDAAHNPVTLGDVKFSNSGVEGEWSGSTFIPSGSGKVTITAESEGIMGQVVCNVISAGNAITAVPLSSTLVKDAETYLVVNLVNENGFSNEVNFKEVSWSVSPEGIGYVEGGKFHASAEDGTAVLTASYNGMTAQCSIVIGKDTTYLEDFEVNIPDVYMSYYPENIGVTGGAGVTSYQAAGGAKSYQLNYSFVGSMTQTQAAYICFKNPIQLAGSPTDLCMWFKGDMSGNLFKGEITDKNGTKYLVTFKDNIDSDQWEYVSAQLPEDISYPASLTKLYVAALETTSAQESTVYIDSISQLAPKSDVSSKLMDADVKRVDLLNTAKAEDEEDITVFGQTKYGDYDKQTILSKMSQNARAMIFAGASDISNTTGVASVIWNNKYFTTETTNASIITLASQNGSIRTSNENQWRWLQGYLTGFSKNNIIIVLDKDIWSQNNCLSDSRENDLLHTILTEFVQETGKNVIVVSASGYSSTVKIKDGVRYITAGGMNMGTPEYLRIRVSESGIKYQIYS